MAYKIVKKSNGVTIEFYDVDATMRRIVNNDAVGQFTAQTWAKYFSKYVPKQEGILMSNYTTKPWQVTYESPYAHYIWNGMLFVSPSTGSAWAKPNEIKVPTNIPLEYSKEQNPLATSHWERPAYEAFKETVAKQIAAYIASR